GAGRRGMSGGWRRDRSVWGRAVGGRGRVPGRCWWPGAGGRKLGAGRLGSGGDECRVPGAGRWWPGVAVRAMAYGRTPWLYRQRVLAYAIRRRGGPARGAGRSASGPTGPGSVVGFGVAAARPPQTVTIATIIMTMEAKDMITPVGRGERWAGPTAVRRARAAGPARSRRRAQLVRGGGRGVDDQVPAGDGLRGDRVA